MKVESVAKPSLDWMPGAVRNQRLSNASFDTFDNPKGLLHTSEGFSIEASENACRAGGFDPHFTIGPDPARAGHYKIVQHYPLSSRATALENDEITGGQTNRQAVWQVELVGTCDPKYKTHPLYIHNWSREYKTVIANWMKWLAATCGIPNRHAKFVAYPSSYGLHASQRLSWSEYCSYSGWIGHQHAAGNIHGDPGDLNVAELLKLAYGVPALEQKPTPKTDPLPVPAPGVDDVIGYRRRPDDVKAWGDFPLPHDKYVTLPVGMNGKGEKIVSLLTGGDNYKPGWFNADLDVVLKTKSKLKHLEVLFYLVDASGKDVKVARKYRVQPISTFHENGLYRVHTTRQGWIGGNHERLRVQVKSAWKNVIVKATDFSVAYMKDGVNK